MLRGVRRDCMDAVHAYMRAHTHSCMQRHAPRARAKTIISATVREWPARYVRVPSTRPRAASAATGVDVAHASHSSTCRVIVEMQDATDAAQWPRNRGREGNEGKRQQLCGPTPHSNTPMKQCLRRHNTPQPLLLHYRLEAAGPQRRERWRGGLVCHPSLRYHPRPRDGDLQSRQTQRASAPQEATLM